jgi:F-type H+-transporting ATPase subunit epsilon
MASHIKLEVVTPTGAVLDTAAEWVSAPGIQGEFGVLPEHRPALIMLGGGAVRYGGPRGEGTVYIRGGMAEVGPDRVLVLADDAVLPGEEERRAAESMLGGIDEALSSGQFVDDETFTRIAVDRAFAESQLGRR